MRLPAWYGITWIFFVIRQKPLPQAPISALQTLTSVLQTTRKRKKREDFDVDQLISTLAEDRSGANR